MSSFTRTCFHCTGGEIQGRYPESRFFCRKFMHELSLAEWHTYALDCDGYDPQFMAFHAIHGFVTIKSKTLVTLWYTEKDRKCIIPFESVRDCIEYCRENGIYYEIDKSQSKDEIERQSKIFGFTLADILREEKEN